MAIKLAQLLGGDRTDGTVDITGLTVDSRAVQKGDMFVAFPGASYDGRAFIDDAISAGASAILTTPGTAISNRSVSVVEDTMPRRKYAELAARFHGAQPVTQVAITGTNGKTSVADFTRQFWQLLGQDAASLGTLGVRSPSINRPGGLTTPDPMALHEILKDLAGAGVQHTAIEASSHGLDQYRLDGVRLKAAAFTNLTRDHLDYHKSEQGYFYAKARLFGELLAPGSTAVINIDSSWGAVIDDIAWARGLEKLTVGRAATADLCLTKQRPLPTGQQIEITFGGHQYAAHLPLIGGFQAENVLLAIGLVIATGGNLESCLTKVPQLVGVPGRMEYVGETASGGSVFVDYAHTPDGLSTVLQAARAHQPKNLHVVFGCGGDRDKGKRPLMGGVAQEFADFQYVTDDNPRTEDAATIRKEILTALNSGTEIASRASAIECAISAMQAGDMLVVAGKGHEEGQVVGTDVLPFSDIETVKTILTNGG